MADPLSTDKLIPTVAHWGAYLARVRDGRLIALEPHPLDPDPSPIGRGIVNAITSEARISEPMIRKSWLDHGPRAGDNARGQEPFVAVSWDRAFELVANALNDVRARHGNAAIFGGSYGWASAGRFHHAQSQLRRFLNLAGGYTTAVNSYSKGALEVILPHVVGDSVRDRPDTPGWLEIAANTKRVIAFGGLPPKNAQVFAGGMLKHDAAEGMDACRRAGVKFVNLGPQRDDIAAKLDAQWLPVRPGSDAAVMLALAHVLITEKLADFEFVSRACIGYDAFRAYVLGESDGVAKSPTWAAALAGLPASDIVALARQIAAQRTLMTVQWSLQRADHGEQVCWLAVALAALSGSMGRAGGGVGFGFPRAPGATPPFRISALPQGTNPVREFIPVARLSDALLGPGAPYDYDGEQRSYPDLRLIYWAGGNPFHHHQDLNRMRRAWQRPETIVIQDAFWTEAARHADVVLPVTTTLERNDIASGPGALMASHCAIAPVGAARSDHDIFAALAARLGFANAFTEGRDEMGWIRWLYDQARTAGPTLPPFEQFWRQGIVDLPAVLPPTPFAGLRENPGRHLLLTPSGKIELFSARIASFNYDDCPGHGAWIAPREWLGADAAKRHPIHLISNQPRARLHGQFDQGLASQASKIAGREPLRLHPHDATARGIKTGDVVRVFNDRGSFLAGAVLTEAIMPGVAQISTGAADGNPNMVTRDAGSSKLSQATSAMSTLVEIEKVSS
ncbi:MAG: Asp-tRNA(Asn)/Glu-tRNA(Gln) amidotransferase GatCAB subunit C [Alphaproteobacteria bacterium]|nr:Asp-tRNA(Asn)/Glu-tRNA(Gln) amidotransferase GatCAB subunit C [Alphaproteobacteria bacterium]